MARTSRVRAVVGGAVVAVVLAITLAACQTARVGARCRGAGLAEDAHHVLQCKQGRWVRLMTRTRAEAVVAQLLARLHPATPVPTTGPATTTTTNPGGGAAGVPPAAFTESLLHTGVGAYLPDRADNERSTVTEAGDAALYATAAGDLVLRNLADGTERTLKHGTATQSWTPSSLSADGSRIGYGTSSDGSPIDNQDGEPACVPPSPSLPFLGGVAAGDGSTVAVDCSGPVAALVSPDGSSVAWPTWDKGFTTCRVGGVTLASGILSSWVRAVNGGGCLVLDATYQGPNPPIDHGVHLVTATGTSPRLTVAPDGSPVDVTAGGRNAVALSGDGRYLAYVGTTSGSAGSCPGGGLFVTDVTAGTSTEEAVRPEGACLDPATTRVPWVSRSGRFVVLSVDPGAAGAGQRLYVWDRSGRTVTRLAFGPGDVRRYDAGRDAVLFVRSGDLYRLSFTA